MELFDTHAHLDQSEFDADRDEAIRRARDAGVRGVLCLGVSADSSAACVALAEAHEGILAAVGIQPNSCAEAKAGDWDRIVALSAHPRVVALGETGLDRYWDFTPLPTQQDYFARHLELSCQSGLPVAIHCRDAAAETLAMLREASRRGPLRGILHAFSGDQAMADECLALGLHISFAGVVTYTNKKFDALREVARRVPAERLLLETDSPYMTPHPLRGKQPRNEPALLHYTAESLAALRGVPVEDLARQTTKNARQLLTR